MNTASPATLSVVGLGPGDAACLTPQALNALENARCIAGYPRYLGLVPARCKAGKTIIATGMREETARCQAAIDMAAGGAPTALVCSGDPGIYALAGLVIELLESRGLLQSIPLNVIPGVPALCAAAALLGAPLTHDFACISLSDLLTPWPLIEKRLNAAFAADFVCVIYNPRSHGRQWQLDRAIDAARRHRRPDCPVGIVRQAFREGQTVSITRLDKFDPAAVDMLSLVVIGNGQSRRAGRYLLTPRGYRQRPNQ